MDDQVNMWEELFKSFGQEKPAYDDWLEKYQQILSLSKQVDIIDLGCGFGNDTLYLVERGYKVISCDYSPAALERLKYFIPTPNTRLFDLTDGLPFACDSAQVVIADLSLHYFPWETTVEIVEEIQRVLISGGYLLGRVNSTKDKAFGAGQGEEIAANYVDINGRTKRFFTQKELAKLFAPWEIVFIAEYTMDRYHKPKVVWEFAVKF